MAKLLLDHGADPKARSDNGQCALDLAMLQGHAAVVALGRIGHPFPWRAIMAQWDAQEGRLAVSDLKALGHRVTGLEGSPKLAALARTNSGCTVLEQNFLALDLPHGRYDGVFANAVLFHVPSQVLPRVLGELHAALKPGGVLFCSNPRGQGQEGWSGDRYGAFHGWEAWRGHVTAAGFTELAHFHRPTGLPLEQQPWLASVWRKPVS